MMSLSGLCAAHWATYLADGIVVVFLLAFSVVCAKRGFVECFFGFVSTIAAILVAVLFAKAVLSITDGLFGLQTFAQRKFTGAFAKLDGFAVDVSADGVSAALAEKNLPAILGRLALKWFGKGELAAGTTLASLLGATLARLAMLLLTGILLFLLVKLALSLARRFLNALAEKIFILDAINALLGAVVGLIEGVILVCLVMSLLTLIPSQTVGNYLTNSVLLKGLYDYNPLVWILSLFL